MDELERDLRAAIEGVRVATDTAKRVGAPEESWLILNGMRKSMERVLEWRVNAGASGVMDPDDYEFLSTGMSAFLVGVNTMRLKMGSIPELGGVRARMARLADLLRWYGDDAVGEIEAACSRIEWRGEQDG